jgi:hypothetical protein
MLFVTDISCHYRDSPYKGDWRGRITEDPRLSRPWVSVSAEALTGEG